MESEGELTFVELDSVARQWYEQETDRIQAYAELIGAFGVFRSGEGQVHERKESDDAVEALVEIAGMVRNDMRRMLANRIKSPLREYLSDGPDGDQRD